MKKLTLKINKQLATKLLNGTIPINKNSSISIKVSDANKILGKFLIK